MKATTTCWLGHDWSQWRVTDRFEINRNSDGGIVGRGFFQERECKRCGKTEIDKQRVFGA